MRGDDTIVLVHRCILRRYGAGLVVLCVTLRSAGARSITVDTANSISQYIERALNMKFLNEN